jgi:carboxypeptidase Taq
MAINGQVQGLRQRLGEIADLHAAEGLLQWDQEVYMPPKGAEARGQQLATVSSLAHRLFTTPEMGELLHGLRDDKDTDPDDLFLVNETLYDYERAAKLPERFVHEFAEASSQAYEAWVRARKESNFKAFQPHLEKVLDLLKEKAELLGYQGSPYNALLEDFERGMTAEHLKALFEELGAQQADLLARIIDSPRQPDVSWLRQNWFKKPQWELCLRIVSELGYDLEAGRQDESAHPFTTSFDTRDVRITTRIDRNDLFSALTSSIHECGHALYDQGFQDKDRRTTLANAPSLGMHESQSRMWENIIGRSRPFWEHYTPLLRKYFPGQLDDQTPEDIYRAINRVERSFIRVEADECTYNLHVILRFELEVDLMEGRLAVADVPEAWNAKIKRYLGLDVPDDAHGCLQDIHWSHGAMGYFPTYTLGNLYAAQLFETILQDIPDLWEDVARGHFAPLLDWLRRHIHIHGRRRRAAELIAHATGREPESAPYLRYLNVKYGELYGLD